ncbi:MAG: MFS transporter [Proteobacteria bacterium]|nr:MFS transporter [Pseudomonadota bacterium]
MNKKQYLPWLMWFFPLAFFGFQFILRLFPGLVMTEFLTKYQITATDFGVFASLYYLGYAGMQIPMASLLDKYGPRQIIACSALLCGFAVWLMLLCDIWWVALLSRFLIGVGSVVGFLGTSKVISIWFAKEKYARLVGLTFSFGLLGALYGGRPVSMIIEQIGWQSMLGLLGLAAILLGLLNYSFVRNKNQKTTTSNSTLVADLKKLITHPSLLILAFANFLMVGALEGFADVWGVPYLMASRHLTKVEAASITSFIFMGMLFGGPILAYFSEKFKAHFQVTSLCGLLMAGLMIVILIFNLQLSQSVLMMLMFTIGILCCYQVIVFAIGAELVPHHLLSVTVAFLNCINMLGGSFFHSVIGRLMDFFEPGMVEGIKTYSVEAYTYTLLIIPIASLIGAFLVWYSRRKSKNVLALNQTIMVDDNTFTHKRGTHLLN